jgi:hypothetical protein
MQVGTQERVWAVADEDLDRATEEKTSAVHFLRFDLSDGMAQALKNGAPLAIGIDHPRYAVAVHTSSASRSSLARDLA